MPKFVHQDGGSAILVHVTSCFIVAPLELVVKATNEVL